MAVDVQCEIDIARPRAEVAAYVSDPDHATDRSADAMETTYTWHDMPEGATRLTLRNRGEPAGFAKVAAPVMAQAMPRAMTKDLRRLSEILERHAA